VVCRSRRPDDPMPILLSANRNPYRAFQFQESLAWDHIPSCPAWDSKRAPFQERYHMVQDIFCFRRNATQSRGNAYESSSSQIAAAHRTAWTRFIAKEEFLNQNNVMVLPRRIRPVSLRYRISVLFTLHAPRTIWAPILQLLSCVNLVFVDMNCQYAHSPLNEMIIMIMNGRY